MNQYVVITQINSSGKIYPVGTLINGGEFTQEQIQEQIRLQIVRPAEQGEFPVEMPESKTADQPNGE